MLLIAPLEIFGVEWDVYLILLILGVPIYFLARWIVRKFTKPGWARTIFVGIATIILAPIIYASIILLIVFMISYYPNRDFNKSKWIANPDNRYEMSKDIIKSKMLLGKSKAEVRQMLGDDGNKDSSDYWIYYLGFKPELFNIDRDLLTIDFKNDKVDTVAQFQE